MKKNWTRIGALALVAAMAAGTAQAQLLKDPQWQDWVDAGKSEELGRAAQARLRAKPDDAQAIVAQALAALAEGDPQRIDAAARALQSCVDQPTPQAICFYALATVQGVEAMGGNVLKIIKLAGPIKRNLNRAVELDPLLFEARLALLQFYLKVPSVAGGSPAKARELAQAAQVRQPEHAKLLAALLSAHDKQWVEMERGLQSVKPGKDKSLHSALRDGWYQLGIQLMFDQQFAHAKTVFEALQRDYPAQAIGSFGLGRLAAEQGQADEAVRQFERARPLAGVDKLPLDYRLGLVLQDRGDKAQARQAFERFVAARKGSPANLDDARKRLAELG